MGELQRAWGRMRSDAPGRARMRRNNQSLNTNQATSETDSDQYVFPHDCALEAGRTRVLY
jgi:hypothetical protein